VVVEDSHLLPHKIDPRETGYVRGGGAVRIVSGGVYVASSQFTRCSAGPPDGDFNSCALSFAASTGLCAEGVGGAISGERASITGQMRLAQWQWRWRAGLRQLSDRSSNDKVP
jgi:hypothetical protein